MLVTNNLKPTGGFTQVLNEAIFDERLTHAEFRLWCRLLALPRGAKQVHLDADQIAKELGMSPDLCRTQRRSLKEKGFLITERGRIVVTMPNDDFKPKEGKLTPGQQARQDLRETWNESKPDTYPRMRNPLSVAQKETLEFHMEHNNQHDACEFLKGVLTGCRAEDWWKSKALNFDNIFGKGRPKENKFTNVQKLFNLSSSKEGRAALFNVNDDQCWLDWFKSRGHNLERVERLTMERMDAWAHQSEADGDNILYVYRDNDGDLVHWTYKENSVGVSYLPTAR